MVNDPDRAFALLNSSGYIAEMRELMAVRLEDRAGSFLKVLEALAKAKVNLQSVADPRSLGKGTSPWSHWPPTTSCGPAKCCGGPGSSRRGAERPVSNADLLAGAPSIPGESVGLLL